MFCCCLSRNYLRKSFSLYFFMRESNARRDCHEKRKKERNRDGNQSKWRKEMREKKGWLNRWQRKERVTDSCHMRHYTLLMIHDEKIMNENGVSCCSNLSTRNVAFSFRRRRLSDRQVTCMKKEGVKEEWCERKKRLDKEEGQFSV